MANNNNPYQLQKFQIQFDYDKNGLWKLLPREQRYDEEHGNRNVYVNKNKNKFCAIMQAKRYREYPVEDYTDKMAFDQDDHKNYFQKHEKRFQQELYCHSDAQLLGFHVPQVLFSKSSAYIQQYAKKSGKQKILQTEDNHSSIIVIPRIYADTLLDVKHDTKITLEDKLDIYREAFYQTMVLGITFGDSERPHPGNFLIKNVGKEEPIEIWQYDFEAAGQLNPRNLMKLAIERLPVQFYYASWKNIKQRLNDVLTKLEESGPLIAEERKQLYKDNISSALGYIKEKKYKQDWNEFKPKDKFTDENGRKVGFPNM